MKEKFESGINSVAKAIENPLTVEAVAVAGMIVSVVTFLASASAVSELGIIFSAGVFYKLESQRAEREYQKDK